MYESDTFIAAYILLLLVYLSIPAVAILNKTRSSGDTLAAIISL